MNQLTDYIQVFENIVPNELCDAVLNEFSNEKEWEQTVLAGGREDTNIRSATTIVMSYPHVIEVNKPIRAELDAKIFACASVAITKYNEKFSLAKIEEDSGYELLRYKEGQFYTQHTDSFKDRPRAVSCSFALNDNYEGGEWGFFSREKVIKVPKGAAVLFPSNFMYPHEIMPVTKGVRYSIITWFI
jgi:predicted 2-oxoglutarate/Fe(II)-dependent dioxygenase YbiX